MHAARSVSIRQRSSFLTCLHLLGMGLSAPPGTTGRCLPSPLPPILWLGGCRTAESNGHPVGPDGEKADRVVPDGVVDTSPDATGWSQADWIGPPVAKKNAKHFRLWDRSLLALSPTPTHTCSKRPLCRRVNTLPNGLDV